MGKIIFQSNIDVSDFKVGSTQVEKIYKGTTQVWPSANSANPYADVFLYKSDDGPQRPQGGSMPSYEYKPEDYWGGYLQSNAPWTADTSWYALIFVNGYTAVPNSSFYPDNNHITDVIVGGKSGLMLDMAFADYDGLKTVVLTDSVISFTSMTFALCDNLESIVINNVKDIPAEAFYPAVGRLSSVTFGSGVRTIGYRAFQGTSLRSVVLPDNIISVAHHAFDVGSLEEITFSNSMTGIPDYCCFECGKLRTINFGSGITTIGYHAFYACSGLTSLVIPDSITTVSGMAFNSCAFSALTLGSGVTTLKDDAFSYNVHLVSITCRMPVAPTINKEVFGPMLAGTLYYPAGSDYSSWLSQMPGWTGVTY